MKTTKLITITAAALAVLTGSSSGATILYGSDVATDELVSIDTSTLNALAIGPFNSPNPNFAMTGLAYDGVSGTLYGIDPATDSIYTINQLSGLATPLVSVDTGDNPNGLAFDPNRNILYISDNNSNGLYFYDVPNAQFGLIGTITGGFSNIEGLGYDEAAGILYGLADAEDTVVRIDIATAQATALPNALGPGIWRGLEFDSGSGVLFATRVNAGAVLTRIDPVTGTGVDIGTMTGGFNFIQGLAVAPQTVPDSDSTIILGLLATCFLWAYTRTTNKTSLAL